MPNRGRRRCARNTVQLRSDRVWIVVSAIMFTRAPIAEDTTVVATARTAVTELEGEIVILDVDRDLYFGLRGVAAHVWKLIQDEILVAEVRDQLLQEYDVTVAECERDLIALLERLRSEKLIEVVGDGVLP